MLHLTVTTLKRFISLFLLFIPIFIYSQSGNIVRGKVIDLESRFPVAFASVEVFKNDSLFQSFSCDSLGFFRCKKLPFGKYAFHVSSVGYKDFWTAEVMVISGKETVVEFPMEQQIAITATVKISKNSTTDKNEMAMVSNKAFDVEEANRYAGSRSDPARMASNFAGVQGSDDTRNDIVIRGNSPNGVLWRIENADVPAPNHFAIPGTNGGPVSMLNNKTLANSEFFTGAFPSEYGNGTAGVFDIKLKNGNNEKHEFTGQLGFLGTELAAEGPLSKKSKSSYLTTFRYSTLQLFSLMGVNIGTTALPKYYDASMKFNFPLKNRANLSFFLIGGRSSITIKVSDKGKDDLNELYGRRDRDQIFYAGLAIGGINYSKTLSNRTFYNFTLSGYFSGTNVDHDMVVRDSNYNVTSIYKKLIYDYYDYKGSANFFINHKFSTKFTLKVGANYSEIFFDLSQKDFNSTPTYTYRIKVKDHAGLVRAYAQAKYKFSERITFSGGLNYVSFLLNSSNAIEPRAALKFQVSKKHSIAVAYGKHSQLQPGYLYFQNLKNEVGAVSDWNRNMQFSKSDHYVLSYVYQISRSFKIRSELYYQWLYNIPVEVNSSSFSMINFGMYARLQYPGLLKNSGTGRNYGAEITVEKNFNHSYFILFTASLFESKYKGSDGVERNTAFNGKYATNLLAGKEWKVGEKAAIVLSGKATRAGGRRYTPLNMSAAAFSEHFRDYFRIDLKVGFKWNTTKVTHELALDLVNVLNTHNVLRKTYIPPIGDHQGMVVDEDQLHFLPIFYYRVDF